MLGANMAAGRLTGGCAAGRLLFRVLMLFRPVSTCLPVFSGLYSGVHGFDPWVVSLWVLVCTGLPVSRC